MVKILAINGSYRDDGAADQIIQTMVETLQAENAQVEIIQLRDHPIEFCLNCRECTQQAGSQPGHCIQNDGMADIVAKIEAADGFILASPTNFGSVTATFKRFMERLIVYAYWPWEAKAPSFRKQHQSRKKAVLVSSCAAPGFVGRLFYSSMRQLKYTAKVIGAETCGSLFGGLMAKAKPELQPRIKVKAAELAKKLL